MRKQVLTWSALILVLAMICIWRLASLPPATAESSEDLQEFCADSELGYRSAAALDDTSSPSVVYWVDRNTEIYDGVSESMDYFPYRGGTGAEIVRSAELIACGAAFELGVVESCRYQSSPGTGVLLDLYEVRLQFTVYEAATHERIGEISVQPELDTYVCPLSVRRIPCSRHSDHLLQETRQPRHALRACLGW